MVVVAGGGVGGGAVELAVGEGDATRGAGAGDEHLAADLGDFDVVCGRVSEMDGREMVGGGGERQC